MDDSDGSEVEFTVVGQSFQLLQTLSEIDSEKEREEAIRAHINSVENEDLPVCPEFYPGKDIMFCNRETHRRTFCSIAGHFFLLKKYLEWFNVSRPLSFEGDLHGKLVVLDFFTYCCINCMHILPDLHHLEAAHPVTEGLLVVGVHSAKFDNEKESANILSAVLRYDITHPVVNDSEARLWNALEVHCWPTLVVVSPARQPLLHIAGERHLNLLREYVRVALSVYGDRGELNIKNDLPLELSRDALPPSPLCFPGKVAIDPTGRRLAIADTGHHRVIVTDLNGIVQTVVGCGEMGHTNGKLTESCLNAPQGLAWKGNGIFIADNENHAIRYADLDVGSVVTLVGTGIQGHDLVGGGQGPHQAISSPWDVVLTSAIGSENKDLLVIAMAGTHQIWLYFLADGNWLKGKSFTKGTCVRFAGTGAEENRNNSYPHNAAFAQPSGLALRETPSSRMLYVADSESSSVRQISLTDGAVKPVVGATRDPRNLFAFGDKDGKGIDVRLQHPLGVAMETKANGRLLIADSYNHKIKAVDLTKRVCVTLLGIGRPGNLVGPDPCTVELNEPGGLCVHPHSGLIYIADTNNHGVKVFDPATEVLTELPILVPESTQLDEVDNAPPAFKRLAPKSAQVVRTATVKMAPGGTAQLQLGVELSVGLHPTEGAPLKWQISVQDEACEADILSDMPARRGGTEDYNNQPVFTVRGPANSHAETRPAHIWVECVAYFCDDAGACRMQAIVFDVPILSVPVEAATNQEPLILHHLISIQ